MSAPTCTAIVDRVGPHLVLCDRTAIWTVGFNDGFERTEEPRCNMCLMDAQERDDYVGARAL